MTELAIIGGTGLTSLKNLDITKRNVPQDGRMRRPGGGRSR